MTHRLLNSYEEVTYHRVKEAADQHDAHVFTKVRLADAIPLNNSGVSDAEFGFALKAHIDFLVTDKDFSPLFAVEFDGPGHRADTQKLRDQQKDALTDRFAIPLLRINANYLNRKYRDLDLITYFIEVWFLREAFSEAQEAGHIPPDEPFDPASVLYDGHRSRSCPYWLNADIQAKIEGLCEAGHVATHTQSYWTGLDGAKRYRCLMWIHLTNGRCCFVETGMRSQKFPVSESDTLMQIATFDLFDQITDVLSGERQSCSVDSLKARRDYYARHFQWMGCGGTDVGPAL